MKKSTLILNLGQLFMNKGIEKPFAWMVKRGIPPDSAHKLMHGKFKRGVPLHHLATICEQLWCTPNDLMAWIPTEKTYDISTHPLQVIKLKPKSRNINGLLAMMPMEDVEEVWKLAEKKISDNIMKKEGEKKPEEKKEGE